MELQSNAIRESDISKIAGTLLRLAPRQFASDLQKMVSDVVQDQPGPFEVQWSRWLGDVCLQLGWRVQIIEGSHSDLLHLINSGVSIVFHTSNVPESEELTLIQRRGRSFSWNETEFLTAKSLLDKLSNLSENPIRSLALESPRGDQESSKPHEPPLRLLWKLLKPEWNDLNIVLLFALILGILTLATPIAVEALVDTVAFGRFMQPVVVLSLILFIFLGFNSLILGLQTYVTEIVQRRLFARCSADIAIRLPRVNHAELNGEYLPETINRFLEVPTIQKATASLVIDGTSLVLRTFIGMTVLAFYHPWLLGFDVLLLVLLTLIVFVLGRGAVATSIEESKLKYASVAWFEEVSRCKDTFRNREGARYCLDKANWLTGKYLRARAKHFRILIRQIAFALGSQAVASTVLLGLGGWLVISGQLTLGQLVAAELIVTVIVGSFTKIGKLLETFYDLLASVDKISHLTSLPLEASRGLAAFSDSQESSLVLRGVGHSRISSRELIDSDINPGEMIVLRGDPGAGKSTLLDLLYGLDFPGRGFIRFRGEDLRDLQPETLRSRVALLREVEVFTGTIRENLLVGFTPPQRHVLNALLERLGLLDSLLSLPNGLETEISSEGRPLTSTQLRLLAIARILLREPEVVLIDGFLDGLPSSIISLILKELRVDGKRILIIGTNREMIVKEADRILNLEVGKQHTKLSQEDLPLRNSASRIEEHHGEQ